MVKSNLEFLCLLGNTGISNCSVTQCIELNVHGCVPGGSPNVGGRLYFLEVTNSRWSVPQPSKFAKKKMQRALFDTVIGKTGPIHMAELPS